MLRYIYDSWYHYAKKSTHIYGKGFYMRPPLYIDNKNWLKARNDSYHTLQPFEAKWRKYPLTNYHFKRYYYNARHSHKHKLGQYWLIFNNDDTLIGAVNYYNWRFSMYHSAEIGYWITENHSNKNIITEAIAISLHEVKKYGIRRIEANTLPENKASCRVLEKNHFVKEGHATEKLRINGAWRNHDVWARILTNEEE